jgi:uncharacterized alkaline shock family protein YloU
MGANEEGISMVSFNRITVILLALAVLGAAVVTILITTGTLGLNNLPDGWFEPQIRWLAEASGGMKAIVVTAAVLVALAVFSIMVAEMVSSRRQLRFLVSSQQEGTTTITRESVRSLAEHVGEGISGIDGVECRVGEKDNGLMIACTAQVAMGASLPELSNQLRADIKRMAEELTGLPVNSVDVDLRYPRAKAQHLAVR